MVKSVDERNQILDEIIKSRRSIRDFKEEKPPKEWIEDIIEAGNVGTICRGCGS